MPPRKLILILATSAGAGHIIAARALEHAFRKQAPDVDVEVHDVLAHASRFFRRFYAGGYLFLIDHAPTFMGWVYDILDKPHSDSHHAIRLAFQNPHTRPIKRFICRRRPDLILNTHFLPAEIVAQLRRAGRCDCPQVTITTDYETHRIWAHPPTERYYTASRRAKTYLTTWGVPAERVLVTGVPVRPGFDMSLSQEDARQRCALDPHRPVVLLLAGAFGIGPIEVLLRQLLSLPPDVQLAVIVGRNEKLRAKLDSICAQTGRAARIIGYTDKVYEWMRAADIGISKAGGLTVAESLACGMPLVIAHPIPGQEARNSDYLLEHGAAIRVNSPQLLGDRVGTLLADPDRLRLMRDATRTIARPNAAAEIVSDALQLLPTS